MLALYLTHPQVQIDPTVPVPLWGLSATGRERCLAAAARAPWVRQLGRIVSSAETKAVEAAAILADAAGVTPEIVEAMGENDRSATGFLTPDLFEAAADRFFAAPEESYRGWERAVDAQRRIVRAVEAALSGHDPAKPVLFVGHGAVGTLLKCHLRGDPISRSADQPGGGGNLFAFRLADRQVLCDWTAIEAWQEKSL